jgi:prophage regulatory protein
MRIMRRKEVKATIGLSRSWIYAAMERGEFPKPIRIGRAAVGWIASCIDEWIAGRENAGDSK